ncbi:unnamed protein product [Dovyalis caffra]|uniref:glucose-6-phosphate 1-epimerase n=1 Tax=Dovyalis caffra TaxID=77055 RepID=A0AAV1RI08_9ROSI|nr:unnamed protein product [Dovyalis caffra]
MALIPGAICGPKALMKELMGLSLGPVMILGPTMNPREAFELSARLPHLGLRVKKQCNRAMKLALRIKKLDPSLTVIYPGLEDHPQHKLLDSMRNKGYGYGGILCIDMKTAEKANVLLDKLQNRYHFGFVAVSLGYYENLMSASGSSTSSEMDPETMKRLGITPGLIRFSIGYLGTLDQKWKQFKDAYKESKIRGMSVDTKYVELCRGINGLDKIILREVRGCSAEVYLYGAHVTSWKNEHGEELLFVSSKAIFKPPKAIRGGIPICFPQFSNLGSLESHGFARTSSSKAFIDLILKHSEEDVKIWPHRYEFRLRITLGPGGDLMLTSRIRNTNTDGKSFTFTFAYHTYFHVTDISEVRVEGVETLDYLDNLKNRERFTEQGDAIIFESEVDKVYLSTPTKIAILDHERKRTFELRKDGLPDAVVWNPWDKKAKTIPDLGDDEYKHMLCVEAACVEKPITLKPGEEWRGRQELSAVPSSYCSGQLDPQRVFMSEKFGFA